MLIDWFTVGAQVLNFLILVWLLRHFLYKPVVGALDAREKHIAEELASAVAKQAEAQRAAEELQNKNRIFDQQRVALLAKAAEQANQDRARLLEAAQNEAARSQAQHAEAMQADRVSLGTSIARLVKAEVFGIARRALKDLAAADLEERMGEVFTRRLRKLDAITRDLLAVALATSPEPALIRSSFALPTQQRTAIQNALNETFSAAVRVRFETEPEAICGIELTANGQKLAWSIADYLESLQRKLDSLLDAECLPASGPPAQVPVARVVGE